MLAGFSEAAQVSQMDQPLKRLPELVGGFGRGASTTAFRRAPPGPRALEAAKWDWADRIVYPPRMQADEAPGGRLNRGGGGRMGARFCFIPV
jgi:hypothetical protein